MERIYINFINVSDDLIMNIIKNSLLISINDINGLNIFIQEYNIRYEIEKNSNNKKFFIEILKNSNIDINNLNTNNFILNISSNLSYIYTIFDSINSIIIYNKFNYYPLIFLGLPNIKLPLNINIFYEYNTILNLQNNYSGNVNLTLFNNYEKNYNYLNNSLCLSGDIYNIFISNDNGITDSNSNKYKIFKIKNNIYLDSNTHIYFYNSINLFSYILYLNNYNFIDYKKSPEEYESVIIFIEYIDTSDNIYSILNYSENNIELKNNEETFYYTYDNLENKKEIYFNIDVIPKYSTVLSLNLQTFNSSELEKQYDNEYYNTLFFYNYINNNYFVK